MIGVYLAGGVSGAHLDPVVTLLFSIYREFPKWKIVPYVVAQVSGAFLGAAAVSFWWRGFWQRAANKSGVTRGQPGSQKLMMALCCYYPNPGSVGIGPQDLAEVSTATAFAAETIMTMLLLIAALALMDDRNPHAPKSNMAPLFIGVVVAAMVAVGGPLTMTALNPARDFGPRLFGYLAGYGHVALPGPRKNEWWVYILAPTIGGLLGGTVYDAGLRPSLQKPTA
jgi:glycerol uptake facilitator protein